MEIEGGRDTESGEKKRDREMGRWKSEKKKEKGHREQHSVDIFFFFLDRVANDRYWKDLACNSLKQK